MFASSKHKIFRLCKCRHVDWLFPCCCSCCVLCAVKIDSYFFLDYVINLHTQYVVFRKEDATIFLPLSLPSADQFSKFFEQETSSKLLVRQ